MQLEVLHIILLSSINSYSPHKEEFKIVTCACAKYHAVIVMHLNKLRMMINSVMLTSSGHDTTRLRGIYMDYPN